VTRLRFISKYAAYTIGFQTEFVEYLQDGRGGTRENTVRPMLDCKFSNHLSLTPWEMEAAKTFRFYGGVVEADEVTPVTPLRLVSVFDTDVFASQNQLDDETKEKLESHLLNRPEHGIDYMRVVAPKIAAPWPAYDDIRSGGAKTTAEKVLEQVIALGFDRDRERLEQIIAYERQNLNRGEIVIALEILLVEPEVEVEDLVSA